MSIKNNSKKYFSEDDIARVLKKTRLGSDLHCHFEGILNSLDLEDIAERLGNASNLKKSTWHLIEKIMNQENDSLNGFLNRLSGRWIRLILIKAMLDGNHTFDSAFPYFIKFALEKIYNQGVSTLELMLSVMTLTNEGDFLFVPVKKDSIPEEKRLVNRWNNEVKLWMANGLINERTLSVQHCFELFNKVIEGDRRFRYIGQTKNNKLQMEVGLKFMIRREKDQKFSNLSESLKFEIGKIKNLYDKNLIVGVDLAGNECNINTPLAQYSLFLKKLHKLKIPFTIHAGEIPKSGTRSEKFIFLNLKELVSLSPKRIGHAVRLFDHKLNMIRLLKKVLKKKIFLELNVSSNILTKTVDNAEMHPALMAIRGVHPLFKDKKSLSTLRQLVLVSDDDPVVEKNDNSIAHELAVVAQYTKNLGYPTSFKMIQELYKNSQKAKLKYKRFQKSFDF